VYSRQAMDGNVIHLTAQKLVRHKLSDYVTRPIEKRADTYRTHMNGESFALDKLFVLTQLWKK